MRFASAYHALLSVAEAVFLVLAIAALGMDLWRTSKEFRVTPRHSSRTRARCESSHLNGDQPKPYEGYVIRVMTPWGASPAPGPVAGH